MPRSRFVNGSDGKYSTSTAAGSLRSTQSGAAAAVRSGYSAHTADRQAYTLLRKPEIADLVAANEAQRLEENEVSAARILEENRRIALNDPRRFVDAAGNLRPMKDWTAEMAAAVSRVEVVKKNAVAGDGHTDTTLKLWFWNKNHALELLSKHLGLLQPEAEAPGERGPVFLMPPGTHIAVE